MNEVFHYILDQYIVVYLDDMLIFSENLKQYTQNIQLVLLYKFPPGQLVQPSTPSRVCLQQC